MPQDVRICMFIILKVAPRDGDFQVCLKLIPQGTSAEFKSLRDESSPSPKKKKATGPTVC